MNTTIDNTAEELRPQTLNDYIGQHMVKDNLRDDITSAVMRSQPLPNTMFHGPPGLGKTTLAKIIAYEMGVDAIITAGPALSDPNVLVRLLTDLEEGDILFIDEIHRMTNKVSEVLYPALEDGQVQWTIGNRASVIKLEPFTLLGATTRIDMVPSPLRDRFGEIYRLEYYDSDSMEEIVGRTAHILRTTLTDGAVREIAVRSRGTPRIGNRLMRNVKDYGLARGVGTDDKPIDQEIAIQALEKRGIDHRGLDKDDQYLLHTLAAAGGGPVGLDTLASSIGVESATIASVNEPFLLKLGLIQKTARGRVLTTIGYRHIGQTSNA